MGGGWNSLRIVSSGEVRYYLCWNVGFCYHHLGLLVYCMFHGHVHVEDKNWMRFDVFTAMRMVMFWILASCRLVGRIQLFEDIYCLHLQGLRNVGFYWIVYTAPKPRRTTSSQELNICHYVVKKFLSELDISAPVTWINWLIYKKIN
jgi:hypothetical protein